MSWGGGGTEGLDLGLLPGPRVLPTCFPIPQVPYLAELSPQPLSLSRVRPCKVDPELLDVAEAEAGSGCGAAVLGGGIHRFQLEGRR